MLNIVRLFFWCRCRCLKLIVEAAAAENLEDESLSDAPQENVQCHIFTAYEKAKVLDPVMEFSYFRPTRTCS